MRQALIAHPGTQYAPKLAKELAMRGLLSRFWTGLAIVEGGWLEDSLLASGGPLGRFMTNRRIESVSTNLLRLRPLPEIRALIAVRRGASVEDALHRRNAVFQRSIADRDLRRADITIGFDTSSWILAERCRKHGKTFILDQSIGHSLSKQQVFEHLRRRFPSWATSAPLKCASHLAEESAEQALATIVVAPSEFVRETLVEGGVAASRIRVNPFGTDLTLFYPARTGVPPTPFIFLFVGSVSARKGVPILLAAWRRARLRDAELWIAGPGDVPREEFVDGMPDSIRLLGTQSREQIAELMRRAHVFVFPSYFEGLAQVQLEALACGLPVIATHESGGSDVIEEGRTGTIVPAGDVDAVVSAMEAFGNNPERILDMRQRLLALRDRWSWSHYGDRWATLLADVA